jgi:phosphopantothenoylcysteine decarboxylase/phosphopantothenate--cysteine ligase
MNVLVTAGPTREYIDSVRFITNASSGRMGYAVADEARKAGHEVTLLTGPTCLTPPAGVYVVHFTTVPQLSAALDERFDACDALVMAAAVGDFAVENPSPAKLRRSAGAISPRLTPTPDLLAGLGRRRRADQILIGFAVEDAADAESNARGEMLAKNVDYVVVNTPEAMGAPQSQAAILRRDGLALPWAQRSKTDLAVEIVKLLRRP